MSVEETHLTGKKPKDAKVIAGRPDGLKEQKLPSGVGARYLYLPDELEGGHQRATDPNWFLEVYGLGRSVGNWCCTTCRMGLREA